ncbi:hypothetical protein, partial [Acetivibrio sp. MSJd-27]|uniref:hypothetical protein n=1 Tax=Acetivibrio sp. MSJd-27 TaxID=2841523 RepID=UPI001C1171A4
MTDIAYNYAPEEEGILYTKTTTVNDVEHVEGQTSVSTHEKYDNLGNLVYQKDGNNNVIAITYDKLGRPLVQTNPDGTTNQFSYDSVSNEIILTNQNNVKQKIKYDKLGRAVSATDFNGNTVTTAYNKLNKETEVVTPMEENVT